MNSAKITRSIHGKVLLVHEDYTLCLNKSKGDKSYFRCSHRTPTQCHATAIINGDLEEGNFEVLSHGVDKHSHDKFPVMYLIKSFHEELKKACVQHIDTAVLKVYEDEKIRFTASLSPAEKTPFLSKLPAVKASLMQGYRARGADYTNLPQTLDQVVFPERFMMNSNGIFNSHNIFQ